MFIATRAVPRSKSDLNASEGGSSCSAVKILERGTSRRNILRFKTARIGERVGVGLSGMRERVSD